MRIYGFWVNGVWCVLIVYDTYRGNKNTIIVFQMPQSLHISLEKYTHNRHKMESISINNYCYLLIRVNVVDSLMGSQTVYLYNISRCGRID